MVVRRATYRSAYGHCLSSTFSRQNEDGHGPTMPGEGHSDLSKGQLPSGLLSGDGDCRERCDCFHYDIEPSSPYFLLAGL